jgi:hypothetical protein
MFFLARADQFTRESLGTTNFEKQGWSPQSLF